MCMCLSVASVGTGGNRIGNWECSEGAKYCQIWAKKMNDGRYAVALYNAVSITIWPAK